MVLAAREDGTSAGVGGEPRTGSLGWGKFDVRKNMVPG